MKGAAWTLVLKEMSTHLNTCLHHVPEYKCSAELRRCFQDLQQTAFRLINTNTLTGLLTPLRKAITPKELGLVIKSPESNKPKLPKGMGAQLIVCWDLVAIGCTFKIPKRLNRLW